MTNIFKKKLIKLKTSNTLITEKLSSINTELNKKLDVLSIKIDHLNKLNNVDVNKISLEEKLKQDNHLSKKTTKDDTGLISNTVYYNILDFALVLGVYIVGLLIVMLFHKIVDMIDVKMSKKINMS